MKTSLIHWNVPAAKAEEAGTARAKTRRKSRVNWLRVLLNRIAPMGYEDEDGFHYGQPPVPPRSNDWLS